MTRTNTTAEDGISEPDENTSLLRRITTASDGTLYKELELPLFKYLFSFLGIIWKILKTSYMNICLVFVPLGIIAGLAEWSPIVIFVLNFAAMIPLISLLAFAAEDLAMSLGQIASRLLDVIFGNAVELIVSNTTGFSFYKATLSYDVVVSALLFIKMCLPATT